MESNVGECELSQRCLRRLHSIMSKLSHEINHAATAMYNAVKQNFHTEEISLRAEGIMTSAVWFWLPSLSDVRAHHRWGGETTIKGETHTLIHTQRANNKEACRNTKVAKAKSCFLFFQADGWCLSRISGVRKIQHFHVSWRGNSDDPPT